jgi:hypothetical protein
LTVTPPVTLALIRFVNPGPGSKNPEPLDDVPVIVVVVELEPTGTLVADVGCAGGGARSFTTSTPYEPRESVPGPSQNSWTDHIVMSSLGSTVVNE